MPFRTIEPKAIEGNVFEMISQDWMLVTSGPLSAWNTMTASWGGFGHLWNRDVAFVFVRPSRHTWSFIERTNALTLSFFGPEWKKALAACGAVSGRDRDKAAMTGLEPVEVAPGAVAFAQASLVLVCGVMHKQDLDPDGFIDPSIADHYDGDYHRLYVARIDSALAASE